MSNTFKSTFKEGYRIVHYLKNLIMILQIVLNVTERLFCWIQICRVVKRELKSQLL